MRAVFTVELVKKSADFPSDEELETLMNDIGRGFKNLGEMAPADIHAIMSAQAEHTSSNDVSASPTNATSSLSPASLPPLGTYEERREHYRALADELFKEMPEVAVAELVAVIYTGYFQKQQALFVLTRMNRRELTFRLLHRELPRLQASTVRMVRDLLSAETAGITLSSDDVDVKVYERKFDHVIIEGRVITRPGRETLRSNIKDSLLFFVPILLFFPSVFFLDHWDALAHNVGQIWHGHLERFSTALLTTALVSFLGLLQTWLQIKKSKLIDWTVRGR